MARNRTTAPFRLSCCITNPAISTFRAGRLCQSCTEVSRRLMNVLININNQQLLCLHLWAITFWDTSPQNTPPPHTHTKLQRALTDLKVCHRSVSLPPPCISHHRNHNSTDAIHRSPPTHWGHMRTWGVCECLYWWRSIDASGMELLLNKMWTVKAGGCVYWLGRVNVKEMMVWYGCVCSTSHTERRADEDVCIISSDRQTAPCPLRHFESPEY